MTIKNLIQYLQELEKNWGNLEVNILDSNNITSPLNSIETKISNEGKPEYFNLSAKIDIIYFYSSRFQTKTSLPIYF